MMVERIRRIVHNQARCKHCGSIIESVLVKPVVYCTCRNLGLYGGTVNVWVHSVNGSSSFELMTEYTDD